MMVAYKSYNEVKQAIRDKVDELLDIGNEQGVTGIRFEFDISNTLMVNVEYTVQRVMLKEEADANK